MTGELPPPPSPQDDDGSQGPAFVFHPDEFLDLEESIEATEHTKRAIIDLIEEVLELSPGDDGMGSQLGYFELDDEGLMWVRKHSRGPRPFEVEIQSITDDPDRIFELEVTEEGILFDAYERVVFTPDERRRARENYAQYRKDTAGERDRRHENREEARRLGLLRGNEKKAKDLLGYLEAYKKKILEEQELEMLEGIPVSPETITALLDTIGRIYSRQEDKEWTSAVLDRYGSPIAVVVDHRHDSDGGERSTPGRKVIAEVRLIDHSSNADTSFEFAEMADGTLELDKYTRPSLSKSTMDIISEVSEEDKRDKAKAIEIIEKFNAENQAEAEVDKKIREMGLAGASEGSARRILKMLIEAEAKGRIDYS